MRYTKIFFVLMLGLSLLSCSMEQIKYEGTDSYVGFDLIYNEDGQVFNYTFSAYHASVDEIKVYADVNIMGANSSSSRTITIEQYNVKDKDNAIAGVHFVALDNSITSAALTVAPNQASVRIPIIFKRDALGEDTFYLGIKLVANDDFFLAETLTQERILTISDILVMPSNWDTIYKNSGNFSESAYWLFGSYGPEKHKIMRDVLAARDTILNEDWIEAICSSDDVITAYWVGEFNRELNRVNALRDADGLDPLSEPVEYNSVTVKFN